MISYRKHAKKISEGEKDLIEYCAKIDSRRGEEARNKKFLAKNNPKQITFW